MAVKNPELLPLFEQAKKLLAPYAKHYSVRYDEPGRYELWSDKEVVVDGRTYPAWFFAGLIIQKRYLGFYYMPVYVQPEIKKELGPELVARLKGKSCFQLRELTPALKEQIKVALKKGHGLYKELDWV